MKALNSNSVKEIITLAEQYHSQGGHPAGTNVAGRSVEDILNEVQETQELYNKVASLNENEKIELCALMWLGRGDLDDWDELVVQATKQYDDNTVDYMTAKSPLANYLRDGLSKLGNS